MQQEKDSSMSGGFKKGNTVFFLAITAVIFCFILYYCTPESCFEETKATVKVMFYDTTGIKSRTPDSLTIMGIGADTTELYRNQKSVKAALLPLDPTDGNSVFLIRINGINDTLTLNYTSFPHLISQECGYAFYHTLTDSVPHYSGHLIKRVLIRNRNITTENEENIRILF
jgi:hypothetical protein